MGWFNQQFGKNEIPLQFFATAYLEFGIEQIESSIKFEL